MHRREGKLIVSATDLVGFLACGHLTLLERAAVAGKVARPDRKDDPTLELLRRRGGMHEDRYIELLKQRGRQITDLRHERHEDGSDQRSYAERAGLTIEAMRARADVIYQATVFEGRWIGHPDFLLRVDHAPGEPPSRLGDYHYQVADTKLAHAMKPSALIQIAAYVEQVEKIQGRPGVHVHVVTGGPQVGEHAFRTAEMMAFYRRARRAFEQAIDDELAGPAQYPIPRALSYPEPVEHCAVCRWYYVECRQRWRDDDALPQVASITRKQRETLAVNSIATMRAFSELTQPLQLEGLRPKHHDAMWRSREQARLQTASRGRDVPIHELLSPERDPDGHIAPNRGLTALPPPTEHDIFFDIEGDPFAFWQGMDYLFGIWEPRSGEAGWQPIWALTIEAEKVAFEKVIDLFTGRWLANRQMHIYHYGSYEPSHLKRLAGRHATRQHEIDNLLRGKVFVDLLQVVRQGLRVGSEGYSIKNLEPLYRFSREIDLRTAGDSIAEFELWLDRWERERRRDDELLANIERYNRDDCVSTQLLRDWLEEQRAEGARLFGELPRPRDDAEDPKEATPWELTLADITARLTAGIPADPADQSPADAATWLVANMLDFHRREDRASWWRFFELLTLTDDELFAEQEPIGRLRHVDSRPTEKDPQKVIHRYRFEAQEHKVGNRSDLHDPRLPPFAEGQSVKGAVDKDALTLEIVRPADWPGPHPTSLVPVDRIPIGGLQDALVRLAEWVTEHGIDSPEPAYRAVRDLLLRCAPRVAGLPPGSPLKANDESGSDAASRLARQLDGTTLPIQGPPGSGKTYSGARMILELVRDGRRVGVTGSNHKVITNLLHEVWAAAGTGELAVLQRIDGEDRDERPWETAKTNDRFDRLLAKGDRSYNLLAGTVWLWARKEMAGAVDTLFVDEAGQVALANVVATGGAARNVVLLGDPQQLDQVLQGWHPPGAGASALGHYLGEAETVPPERGLFLESTWRMHPQITRYTSELFYEDRLGSRPGLESQRVRGDDWLAGSGLRWVPVAHDGNTNASAEEAEIVAKIVRGLIGRPWVDSAGREHEIGWGDIVIVSPFNAHRLLISGLLGPAARVGTVDKFQGQQAPVSIYTMATSRPEDAPRGMDFLFSLNRLNVATSRAKALAIVVASEHLLSAVPRTPEQLRMINSLCAFVELAGVAPEGAASGDAENPQRVAARLGD
ncbi:TM0106 family RecB-like putative nuclease [soil metagenome]